MSHTKGSAAGSIDLLVKLRTWLAGEGWDEITFDRETNAVWLRGAGAGIASPAIAGIAASERYWRIRGSFEHEAEVSFDDQPKASPVCWFNIWENHIDYWFIANSRRFIVIAKCSTAYISMYAGFFLPYALPGEYLYPFYIAGNFYKEDLYTVNNAGNKMFADPGDGSAYYSPRGVSTWSKVLNHSNSSNVHLAPAESKTGFIFPSRTSRYCLLKTFDAWDYGGFLRLRPNARDEAPLFQCHIVDTSRREFTGALDGVYRMGGYNRTPEQIITHGDRSFQCFPNIYRIAGGDFFAVELI